MHEEGCAAETRQPQGDPSGHQAEIMAAVACSPPQGCEHPRASPNPSWRRHHSATRSTIWRVQTVLGLESEAQIPTPALAFFLLCDLGQDLSLSPIHSVNRQTFRFFAGEAPLLDAGARERQKAQTQLSGCPRVGGHRQVSK